VKVLILLGSNGWGGAERVGCTVYRMAQDAGHDVRVEARPFADVRAGVRGELGIELPGSPDEDTLFRWANAARERARAFAPDVIHVHLAWPSLASAVAWIADSFPLVITFQLLPAADKSWPKDVLLRLRSPQVLRLLRFVRAKRVLCGVSVADRDRLRQIFPRDWVSAVLNPPALPPLAAPKAPEVHWRPGAVRLLSVARICKQKGLDRMARALATPELKALPWHWIIIGDGDERASLEALLVELDLSDRVTLAGARPAHDVMPTAELVLSPSRWEGMPLVPMEAIVNGVPIVGSTIPSHRELFSKIPRSLLAEDEASWPAALGALLRDDRARAQLKAEQAELRAVVGPERTWREYELMYRALTER
jgi:glycosyltransferase involved in cell wall biosynthesis